MKQTLPVGRLLAVAVLAVAAQAATLVRHPYLQNVRPNAATVLWTTLEPGQGRVEYQADGGEMRAAAASLQAFPTAQTGLSFDYYQYRAELAGLRPGTEYTYRILVDQGLLVDGEPRRFRSAGPGPFTFLVVGDSGSGWPEAVRLAEQMTREAPALVLHVGDVSQYDGLFADYENFYFAPYRSLMQRVPFYPTPGNHDYVTNDAAAYLAGHAPPVQGVPAPDRGRYYSFDWGDVHFVSLDTNMPLIQAATGAGPMLQWLENDLASTRRLWRVVYYHHGPHPAGPHMGEVQAEYGRKLVAPILERYGVQVAFNGHEHFYMRTHPLAGGARTGDGTGTVYLTTGGGGSYLHTATAKELSAAYESTYHYLRCEVNGGRLTVQAIGFDGREIDRFTLSPSPRLLAGGVVNSASYRPEIAPGELVSIFGLALGVEDRAAGALPLPQNLGATTVSLAGRPLPLLFVSSTQINAQLPFDIQGRQTLVVTTPNGSANVDIDTVPAAPAIFVLGPGGQPAVVHISGALVSSSAPARPGETVSVYLTGLGCVRDPVQAGQPAPAFPPASTVAAVHAQLTGGAIPTLFAGLAPGFAGLYQVNVRIPADVEPGYYDLRILAEGRLSDPVPLPVGW